MPLSEGADTSASGKALRGAQLQSFLTGRGLMSREIRLRGEPFLVTVILYVDPHSNAEPNERQEEFRIQLVSEQRGAITLHVSKTSGEQRQMHFPYPRFLPQGFSMKPISDDELDALIFELANGERAYWQDALALQHAFWLKIFRAPQVRTLGDRDA